MDSMMYGAPAPDLRGERRNLSRIGFGIFALVALSVAGQFAAAAAVRALAPGFLRDPWGIYVISVAPMYLVAMPVCWIILRAGPVSRPETLAMRPVSWLQCFLVCLPILFLGNALGTGIGDLIGDLLGHEPVNILTEVVAQSGIWQTLVFAVLLGPVMEELTFRRFLIDRLRRYGDGTAVLVSGLIFGLFHGNLYQFFYAAALGFLFGWVYCRTGRLRHTILLHVAVNFLGSVVSLLVQRSSAGFLELAAEMGRSGSFSEILSQLASRSPEELRALLLGAALTYGYSFLMYGGSAAGVIIAVAGRKKILFAPGAVLLPREKRFAVTVLNWGMILAILALTGVFVFNTLA